MKQNIVVIFELCF